MYSLAGETKMLPLKMYDKYTVVRRLEYDVAHSTIELNDGTVNYIYTRICRLMEYTLAFDSTILELQSSENISVDSWEFNVSF